MRTRATAASTTTLIPVVRTTAQPTTPFSAHSTAAAILDPQGSLVNSNLFIIAVAVLLFAMALVSFAVAIRVFRSDNRKHPIPIDALHRRITRAQHSDGASSAWPSFDDNRDLRDAHFETRLQIDNMMDGICNHGPRSQVLPDGDGDDHSGQKRNAAITSPPPNSFRIAFKSPKGSYTRDSSENIDLYEAENVYEEARTFDAPIVDVKGRRLSRAGGGTTKRPDNNLAIYDNQSSLEEC
jgi:hypothetical protein